MNNIVDLAKQARDQAFELWQLLCKVHGNDTAVAKQAHASFQAAQKTLEAAEVKADRNWEDSQGDDL